MVQIKLNMVNGLRQEYDTDFFDLLNNLKNFSQQAFITGFKGVI